VRDWASPTEFASHFGSGLRFTTPHVACAVEAYLKECLGSWTPSVGSQGVREEALLSLLHDCDYEFDAARRRHALQMEAIIEGIQVQPKRGHALPLLSPCRRCWGWCAQRGNEGTA
jgi:hypothetical protein